MYAVNDTSRRFGYASVGKGRSRPVAKETVMRRHILRAMLLATMTGCDAQALRGLVTTPPATVSPGGSDGGGQKPAADATAALLARLADLDVTARLKAVSRPTSPLNNASPLGPSTPAAGELASGGSGLTQPEGALRPSLGEDSSLAPPMLSGPEIPAQDTGWQGLQLDFGAKDWAGASAIARKLSSVLEGARPAWVHGALGPKPYWYFQFVGANGGVADIHVHPEGAALAYLPGPGAGPGFVQPPFLDLDRLAVDPEKAVALVRKAVADPAMKDLAFGEDLYPEIETVSQPVSSEPEGVATIGASAGAYGSSVRRTMENVAGDGATNPYPSVVSAYPPYGEVASGDVPMPQLPPPSEEIRRDLPEETQWFLSLQRARDGRMFWRVEGLPAELSTPGMPMPPMPMPLPGSGEGGASYPGSEPAAPSYYPEKAVMDLGETDSVTVSPVTTVAPYPGGTVTSGPLYGGVRPPIVGWSEPMKFSYSTPLSAALDAESGKILGLLLPRQVVYYHVEPKFGPGIPGEEKPECPDCESPYPSENPDEALPEDGSEEDESGMTSGSTGG